VETNLVWFEIDPELGTAADIAASLKARGVLVHVLGKQIIRATTHLDVSAAQALRAAETIRQVVRQGAAA
jgi:threonine aldolase